VGRPTHILSIDPQLADVLVSVSGNLAVDDVQMDIVS
jgi:hypothetical protein